MDELKPCPFCGSEKIKVTEGPVSVKIYCVDCGAAFTSRFVKRNTVSGDARACLKESAFEKWNAGPKP